MATLVEEGAKKIPGTEVRVRSTDDGKAEDVIWCDGTLRQHLSFYVLNLEPIEGLAVGTPTNLGGEDRACLALGRQPSHTTNDSQVFLGQ